MATQQNSYGEWQLNDNGIEWKDWKSSNKAYPSGRTCSPTLTCFCFSRKLYNASSCKHCLRRKGLILQEILHQEQVPSLQIIFWQRSASNLYLQRSNHASEHLKYIPETTCIQVDPIWKIEHNPSIFFVLNRTFCFNQALNPL